MKKVFNIVIVLVIILAIGIFSLTLYRALYVSPDSAEMPSPPAGLSVVESASSTEPTRLIIPSLSINANVQHVGLAKSGDLGIPSNFTDAAWYKYGPVPGAVGNAIIDGHLDNAVSLPGVFKHLNDIEIGDGIYVTTASGQSIHFKVTGKESLPYNSTSTAQIFGASSTANLILITCGGSWDQAIKEYLNRSVIYSTLVQ